MPVPNTSLPRLAPVLLPLALAGCVLMPPLDSNQQFRLSKDQPVAAIVQVIDDRSPQERAERSRSDGWQVGEASMTPDVASYVAQEMTRVIQASPDRSRLEALLAGRTVHLRHFEAAAERAQGRAPGIKAQTGASPSQTSLADGLDLVGTAMNTSTNVHVAIEIDVDAVSYANRFSAGTHVSPFEELLVEPAHYAVLGLVAQIGRPDAATPPPP